MVLLLLPSQSVLALPRPQLVNGRAVTISSGTAETAVCMPLSAAAHSEPHSQLVARLVSTRERAEALSQLVARLVSTRERAQALTAASAARQRQLRHCRDRGSSRAAREHEGASSRTLAARCAAREHEGASSGTRSCISRSSAAQLGSACAPTAHSHTRLLRWCCCCCRVTISSGTAETAVCMPLDQMVRSACVSTRERAQALAAASAARQRQL